MEQTPYTLQGAHCLVIGAGRVGFLLARKLQALGAAVSVSARASRDFARLDAAGLPALDTVTLAPHLSAFPLVFNTVPAAVLGQTELAALPHGCLLIDLASRPGGIDPQAVPPAGCHIIHALSLPGRVAPYSAARAVCDVILTILREEGLS